MANLEEYGTEKLPNIGGAYGLIRGISKEILERFYDINFVDMGNVPTNREPLLIVSNHDTPNKTWYFKEKKGKIKPHTHSVDHLLIGMFLKQRIHAMASTKHYDNKLRKFLLDILEQVPANEEGMREAREYLERGDSIMIFPEGNSGQGTLMGKEVRIRSGLGRLVEAYPDVRILPTYVRIEGKRDSLWPKFDHADVVFGEPFRYLEGFHTLPTNEHGEIDHKRISEEVMGMAVMPLEERLGK